MTTVSAGLFKILCFLHFWAFKENAFHKEVLPKALGPVAETQPLGSREKFGGGDFGNWPKEEP